MNVIALVTKRFKRALKCLGIENLGPKRPFMSLFLGAFLVTGCLPLLTYLVFASVVVCLGVFLLVVIEGGIITVATVTLMAALILPTCIACGLALFVYTVYAAFSQLKHLVESAANVPQKLFSGDGFTSEDRKERFDEKPEFQGKARFRGAKKTSQDAGNDCDSEANDADETKPNLLSGGQHKPVSA